MLKVKKMLNFIEHIMSIFFHGRADQYKPGPSCAAQTQRLQTNKTSSPVAFEFIVFLNAIST